MLSPVSANTPAWTWAVPLIVATVTFIGVMLSMMLQWRNFSRKLQSAHALKMAEMRQQYIHNLREAMAEFLSYASTPTLDQASTREFYEYASRIELMLNPNDEDYMEMIQLLRKFLHAAGGDEKLDLTVPYVRLCQRILKREWNIAKSGIYRF